MRHVLHAAYQLKPKCISKMKFNKGTKLNGRAVLSLLNFDKYKEKEEEDEQKQRMSRAWAEYEQRLNRGKGVKPPPGFENLDQVIAKKISHLRQLKSDFLRLPFQAIEVYLAHVNPSSSEMQTDITS